MLQRVPTPALRPFVRLLWASDGAAAPVAGSRERLLPSGATHLALRLHDEPVRLYAGPADRTGFTLGHAVVGGAREAAHEKAAGAYPTAGAVLEPGAAGALLGAPAGALAGRHTALGDLWGAAAGTLRERLLAARTAQARLDLLEAALLARLRGRVRLLHPAVAEALSALHAAPRVGDAVARTGCSHRHLLARFREEVGLAPKAWTRVLRFQRAVALLAGAPAVPLGEVALRAGYADQAHLGREVRALAGVTPGAYRRAGVAHPNHLPLGGEVNSVQEAGAGAR